MPRLSPQQIADKMASRASAAQGDYKAGVMAVTVSPGQKAAANAAGYVNGVNANVEKWKRNVGKVDLTSWQNQTAAKADRFASGVTAAKPKIVEFWNTFGPQLDSVTARVKSMPNGSTGERIARAVAQMQGVHDVRANG